MGNAERTLKNTENYKNKANRVTLIFFFSVVFHCTYSANPLIYQQRGFIFSVILVYISFESTFHRFSEVFGALSVLLKIFNMIFSVKVS